MVLIPIALFSMLALLMPNSAKAKNVVTTVTNVVLFVVVPEYSALLSSPIIGLLSVMGMWLALRVAANHTMFGELSSLRSIAWRNRYFAFSFAVGGSIAKIH
jgi:hypothetical protein